MKAAIYLRVSTDEQPQRMELHEVCARRSWTIAAELEKKASGAKFRRSGLDQVLALVCSGQGIDTSDNEPGWSGCRRMS